MESRFPAILFLWLGRDFYRGGYGMTGSSHAWTPDLGYKHGYHFGDKFGNLGDKSMIPENATLFSISLLGKKIRSNMIPENATLFSIFLLEKGIHEKTPCDVTACRREYLRTALRSEERLYRLGSPWSTNVFGVLPAVRAGELS
ncbi:hypothetical protein AVEN_116339-1 [Araneus ventricosus]|uniref:Uncharacterized protein n=1 Tax=Araneus ventricosus TaxID=182803 RepID=A0A4Y2WVX6_ARAVE|nr:hypothetical protein AVEN_116339-1 [Araneus ventricosus]